MQLDLVNGGDRLAGMVVEELFEVLDGEVGHADGAHFAGPGELLHLGPGLDEVPVWQVLFGVFGVGGGRPVLWGWLERCVLVLGVTRGDWRV